MEAAAGYKRNCVLVAYSAAGQPVLRYELDDLFPTAIESVLPASDSGAIATERVAFAASSVTRTAL